jgi:hypothetical protein
MPNFQRLFDLNFWFSLRPNPLGPKGTIFVLIFFGLITLIGVIFALLPAVKKGDALILRFFRKAFNQFFIMGVIGFVLFFLSYEQIFFLGSYFWYLLWFIGFAVWSVFTIHFLIKKIPQVKEEREKQKRFQKYLV